LRGELEIARCFLAATAQQAAAEEAVLLSQFLCPFFFTATTIVAASRHVLSVFDTPLNKRKGGLGRHISFRPPKA